MKRGLRRAARRKWLFMKFFHCVWLNLPYLLNFLGNILRLMLFKIYFMKAKAMLNNVPKGFRVRVVRTKKQMAKALLFLQLIPKFLLKENCLVKENIFIGQLG